jgi:hypothetical protein
MKTKTLTKRRSIISAEDSLLRELSQLKIPTWKGLLADYKKVYSAKTLFFWHFWLSIEMYTCPKSW